MRNSFEKALIAIIISMLILIKNCYALDCDQKVFFLISKETKQVKLHDSILNKIREKENGLLFSELSIYDYDKLKSTHKSRSIFIASTPETYKWLNLNISRENAFFVSLSRAFIANNEEKLNSNDKKSSQIRGLYADPDPRLQVALARLLLGKNKKIALLYTNKTSYLNDLIIANKATTKLINSDQSDLRKSFRKLENFDALVAVPDYDIYNRYSIPDLISYLYRKGKPLVGYSKSMVLSGALGTMYSDVSNTSEDIINSVKDICSGSFGKKPKYGSTGKVMVNDEIAKTLNIAIENNNSELAILLKKMINQR